MTDFDMTSFDELNEMENDVITGMNQVNPVDVPDTLDTPFDDVVPIDPDDPTISISTGYCICSCDMTCTRA